MRYSLDQINEFDKTLPAAVAAPTLMVNNGYASLRKLSDHEYLAIWSDADGRPARAGVLDTEGYAAFLGRLAEYQPDEYGYALVIADCANYQFDAQGKPYLPESGSDYDFAD